MTTIRDREYDWQSNNDQCDEVRSKNSSWQLLRYLPTIIRRFWMSDVNIYVVEIAHLQPGERALDIGAGLGPATVCAARQVQDGLVIAVDPSLTMRCALAARKLAQRHRSRIKIRDGSAEHLPVASASIDVAWAVNAVHHFADLPIAMAGIARALKPGGRLLLVEEDFEHPDHEFTNWIDDRTPHDEETMNGLDLTDLTDAIQAAGFEQIEVARPRVKDVPVIQVRAVYKPVN